MVKKVKLGNAQQALHCTVKGSIGDGAISWLQAANAAHNCFLFLPVLPG